MAEVIFLTTSFKDVQAGRCVSKKWNTMFNSDGFCSSWGSRFLPATPKSLGMSPQEFIRYWSTPSFTIIENLHTINSLSADCSTLAGYNFDTVTHRKSAVQLRNGEIEVLACSDDGGNAEVLGVSADGSTIVGYSFEQGKTKTVQWKNDEFEVLPDLDAGYSAVSDISADGSTIIGHVLNSATHKAMAVQWINSKIEVLPCLKEGDIAWAHRISKDGSNLAGISGHKPAYWTKGGVFSIQQVLEKAGVTLGGLELGVNNLISANGLLVVGQIAGREGCYFKAILPSKM